MLGMHANYLAVFVSTVVGMGIGALWYSPVLFGKQWMKLTGMTEADLNKAKESGMARTYAIAFLASLVMACILAVLVGKLGAVTIFAGAKIGFVLWLGFIATTFLNAVLWERKPFNLYLINVLHYLVVLKVMGAILAVWQ